MKIIEPSFEILTEINGDKILKNLERAGRTCYKSESNITDESAKKFISSIIKSGHFTILEHFSVSVKIICDRGILTELSRHRLCSLSVESTRFCDYTKDKFKSQITCIEPFFWECNDPDCISGNRMCMNCKKYQIWENTMTYIEDKYIELIEFGATAQEARSILPNSLKTEIIMTANLREWRHIFNLRAIGTTGKPHPQMLEIMIPMLSRFKELIPVVFDDLICEI